MGPLKDVIMAQDITFMCTAWHLANDAQQTEARGGKEGRFNCVLHKNYHFYYHFPLHLFNYRYIYNFFIYIFIFIILWSGCISFPVIETLHLPPVAAPCVRILPRHLTGSATPHI